MNAFPAVDPIPLPAPVWLFKVLHVTTLSLHFIAVEMLLGGLLVAVVLNFLGRSGGSIGGNNLKLNAAAGMARRLPIVMTYVINLGVPPLLFAQVLYGRALYTSSVLIGFYWIGVVFLLMACYWLLYKFSAKAEKGGAAWPLGLFAWLLAGSIAKIYSTNMTLMLRPEIWNAMYSTSAQGTHLPHGDPTLLARWIFMVSGGLLFAGLWMLYLSGRRAFESADQKFLANTGGKLAIVMALVQVGLAWNVLRNQPEIVRNGLASNLIYEIAGYLWLAGIALAVLAGFKAAFTRASSAALSYGSILIALIASVGMTVYRDGIRDMTLASKGYDVWDRIVVTNWPVVILFLVLFVAGLGGMAWLVSVVRQSRPITEKVSQ